MTRSIDIEALCAEKGLRITEQRKVIARVLGESEDHPDVEALHARAAAVDPGISIATVYRTVRLFEEAGILERHDFGDGRARYEAAAETHHDHLIDVETGNVIEFVDEELEELQRRIAAQARLPPGRSPHGAVRRLRLARQLDDPQAAGDLAPRRHHRGLRLLRAAPLSVEDIRRAARPGRRSSWAIPAGAAACGSGSRARRSPATCSTPPIMSPGSTSWRWAAPCRPSSSPAPISTGIVRWASSLNDSIYITRDIRSSVKGQAGALRAGLEDGRAVCLFPEGTTNGGHDILPFRPSLFASLYPPIPGVMVQPVVIDFGPTVGDAAVGRRRGL